MDNDLWTLFMSFGTIPDMLSSIQNMSSGLIPGDVFIQNLNNWQVNKVNYIFALYITPSLIKYLSDIKEYIENQEE